jgi:translation elongation factor EF-1beta
MTIADISFLTVLWGGARGPKLPDSVMKKLPNMSKWYNNMVSQDFFKKCFGKDFAMKVDYILPDQEAVAARIAAKAAPNAQKPAEKKAAKADKKAEKKADKKAEKKVEVKAAPAPAPAKAADDDFDLFGDETEEDKKAAEELKTKVEAPKKVKVAPIAKSLVCFDVKGYEVGQDFEAMAAKIRAEVNADGLIWMDTHKVVPIAFGMMKLQMTMLIVDDKIQTDDIFEQIEAWEDDVQSTDVVSFNKA